MLNNFTLHLYTTKEELDKAKNGFITAWTKDQKPKEAIYHISVNFNICEILDNEVKIQFESLEEVMGKGINNMFDNISNIFTGKNKNDGNSR